MYNPKNVGKVIGKDIYQKKKKHLVVYFTTFFVSMRIVERFLLRKIFLLLFVPIFKTFQQNKRILQNGAQIQLILVNTIKFVQPFKPINRSLLYL